MTEREFRRIALGHDGALEAGHMGHPDFRVNGRVFATLQPQRAAGMVKLTPEQQAHFVDSHDGFMPESGAWGRQGCTRVLLASVDAEALGEAMTLAWRNASAAPAGRKASRPRTR
jgi:hypothetical protein